MTKSTAATHSTDILNAQKRAEKPRVLDTAAVPGQAISDMTYVPGNSMVTRSNTPKTGAKKENLSGQEVELPEGTPEQHADAVPTSADVAPLDVIVAQSGPTTSSGGIDASIAHETTFQTLAATVGGSVAEAKSSITAAASALTSGFMGLPGVAQAAVVVGGLAATASVLGHSGKTSHPTEPAVDTTSPKVSVTSSSASLAAGATATIHFTLSEASTDFVVGDVTVTGGTLSNFSGSGTSYSATFTKDATGPGTVSVASSKFTDAAGNANQDGSEADNTVSMALTDTTPPTVAVTSTATTLVSGATTTINFNLSEASADFAEADVTVTGGTLSNFSGSGTSYSATFTKDGTGSGTISVANSKFTDAAGNANQDGSEADNTVSMALTDITPPTVSMSSSSASLAAGATATINFTLSEASTDFVVGDVTVAGGTLSNFSGSGTFYSATFTKGATGTGAISVANTKFTDAAGNANQDGSDADNTLSISLLDITPPTVSVAANSSSLLPNMSTSISFTLSEPSTNFTLGDVTVTGGTLAYFGGFGTTYSAWFTKSATGPGTVSVASGVFTDAAGNANQDGSDTNNTVTIALTDNTPPTFTVTSNVSSLSTGETGILTFVFNEDVTMTLASMNAGYKPNGIQQYLAVTRIDNRNYTVEFSPQENLMQPNYHIEFGGYSPSQRIGATDGGNNNPSVGYGAPGTTVTISIDTSTAYLDLLHKIDPADPAYATATYSDFYAAFGAEFYTLTGIQNAFSADPSKMAILNTYLSSMTRTNWHKAELKNAIQAISALYDGINQGAPITSANLAALQITGLADQNAVNALVSYIQNSFNLQFYQNWDSVTELQAIVNSDRSPPTLTLSSAAGTHQSTDSISVSSNEVGYVYLVRDGTNLFIFANGNTLSDNEMQSFNNVTNDSKINKVQITQPGVTEQLSLAGLIGGNYHLYTVDAAGNKSAASADVISIPIIPPSVSVNSIYANNTGSSNNLPLISVSTNAASGQAYLVPVSATIQSASDLNNGYLSHWISNGVTNNWRLPSYYLDNFQAGEYVIYVKDSETDGISLASTNKIVVDNTIPHLTDASPSVTEVGIGGGIQARSNEQGYIYLLQQGMNQLPDPTSLLDSTSSYSRVQVTANNFGQNLTILTNGLQDGTYWVASVDRAGNWSDYSDFGRSVRVDNTPPDPPQVLTTSLGENTFASINVPQYDGVVYIVKDDYSPTSIAEITALPGNHWNSISVPTGQRTVNDLPGTGLAEGTYKAYYSEASGNLSAASSTTILFDVTDPTVTYADTRVAGTLRIGTNQTLRTTGTFDFISSESGWAHLVDSNATINDVNDFWSNGLIRQSQQFQIVNAQTPVHFTLSQSDSTVEGTFKLYIADSAGNVSSPNSSIITIDNTAPVVSLDNGNQGNGNHQVNVGTTLTNITITNPDGPQAVTTYLVNAGLQVFTIPQIEAYGDSQWNSGSTSNSTQGSISTVGLNPGQYKLYASDDVGNLSVAATYYVILI